MSQRIFWDRAGHLRGGSLQFPPPCLRNRLFPKLVHLALGVIGVTDSMAVELGEFDERDGWILESRIDQQGGVEVGPLPIKPLMSRILSSTGSYGFLVSVEITQKFSSGGRGGYQQKDVSRSIG